LDGKLTKAICTYTPGAIVVSEVDRKLCADVGLQVKRRQGDDDASEIGENKGEPAKHGEVPEPEDE